MDIQDFDEIIGQQIDTCSTMLLSKGNEYAAEDRLHNFRLAANLQGTTMEAALAGMMAKHTVSLFDMMRDDGQSYPDAVWTEKITDHINYLLILKAIVDTYPTKGKHA